MSAASLALMCLGGAGLVPGGSAVKTSPAHAGNAGKRVPSLSQEDPLEEGMATHSSILAWRIPWKDKPDRLQPVGSQRVGQDRATTTHSGQEDESRSAG